MSTQGVAALPSSKYKFDRTINFLIALRGAVELKGFSPSRGRDAYAWSSASTPGFPPANW